MSAARQNDTRESETETMQKSSKNAQQSVQPTQRSAAERAENNALVAALVAHSEMRAAREALREELARAKRLVEALERAIANDNAGLVQGMAISLGLSVEETARRFTAAQNVEERADVALADARAALAESDALRAEMLVAQLNTKMDAQRDALSNK